MGKQQMADNYTGRFMQLVQDEQQLIARAASGDRRACERLYHLHERPLYLYALRSLGSGDEAAELVQQTFIRFFRSIRQFEGRSVLRSYLFAILNNLLRDFADRRREVAYPILELQLPSGENMALRLELEQAIANLPQRMRQCFLLFAVEGFKQEEIAEMLALHLNTVKTHVFRARKKLRRLFMEVEV